MQQHRARRAILRELADQLIAEYAGVLPPGQVLAVVFRADQSLRRTGGFTGEGALVLEPLVRQTLARRVMTAPRPARPAGAWSVANALAS